MNARIYAMMIAAALSGQAVADDYPAYWVGSDGNYARGGFGDCLRTINWTPEKAIAGCEDGSGITRKSAPVKVDDSAAADDAAAKAKADADKAAADRAAAKAEADRKAAAAAAAAAAANDKEPQYRNLSLASGATFELGGSTLSGSGKQAVADILKQFEGEQIRSVRVEGHTDDRGAASFNQQLSEKRAAAVRDELIANGVDANVIETVGYGESRPLADNGTRAGRAQNRRVDIKIDARTRQL